MYVATPQERHLRLLAEMAEMPSKQTCMPSVNRNTVVKTGLATEKAEMMDELDMPRDEFGLVCHVACFCLFELVSMCR